MSSRRDALKDLPVGSAQHAGLWADRYLARHVRQGEAREPYDELVKECSQIDRGRLPFYQAAFDRWRQTLAGLGAQTAEARAPYRLAAGLGRSSVIENGLTIHHTYGVPYIPGSSLKGVAAAYANRRLDDPWKKEGDAYKTLFGTTETAGYVTFLDALPLPTDWQILRDVMTVHHSNYYKGTGDAPADWDDPTPLSFLSVTGTFLIAVAPQAGATAWAERALELLLRALAQSGVGGKTSSGYGRLEKVSS